MTASWQIAPETHLNAEVTGRTGKTSDPAATATLGLRVGF